MQKVVNQLPASMSTQNDRNVLNSILNPNLPLGEGVFDPDQQAPESLTEAGYNDDNVKQLEKDGVRSAEEGNLNKALELFNEVLYIKSMSKASGEGWSCFGAVPTDNHIIEVVALAPLRASSYNNRAQALRLAGRPAEALKDLNKAIELSKGEGRAGSSALCQRGILHRRVSIYNFRVNIDTLTNTLYQEGRDDDALKDFKAAASEGSGFGKTMLVEMNPYAAMCNAMLKNVFTAMANGDDSEKLMSQNMKTKSG